MSRLINPNDYIKVANYAEKYNINKRKVYRYRDNDQVDFVEIDEVLFIRDIYNPVFETKNVTTVTKSSDNVTTVTENSVTPVTKKKYNVTTVTEENIDNQEDKGVTPVTKKKYNVTTVTEENNVTTVTSNEEIIRNLLTGEELILLNKNEDECSISDFEKRDELKKKIKKYLN